MPVITVPKNAEVVAKIGDNIDFDEPLFRLFETKETVVSVSDFLRIPGDKIYPYLKKLIGDEVVKGEVIAEKKALTGSKKIDSPVNGKISRIDHNSGEVFIAVEAEINSVNEQQIDSFFKGKITSYDEKDSSLTIELHNTINMNLKQCSSDGGGKVFYFLDESVYFTASQDDINDKVVVIESLKTHIKAKCEALGAKGFICIKSGEENFIGATIASFPDFEKVTKERKNYILYSCHDKKASFYD